MAVITGITVDGRAEPVAFEGRRTPAWHCPGTPSRRNLLRPAAR
jgi:hypothetical protein